MPNSNRAYFHEFPVLTNRDAVRAFDLLRLELKIRKIHTIIGGSLGGQQVLEWAILQPQIFEHIVPIACNAFHSPWGIAFNEAQRLAIEADPTWKEDEPRAGIEGLKAARAIGMISYRHYTTYVETQSEKTNDKTDDFRAATYQRYQGEKLANRFNAFTYWLLSKMMDSHHVGRKRESVEAALKQIQARALIIGIESDILFPLPEQKFLAEHISNANLEVITSIYGHDGFLVEFDQLKKIITHYLNKSLSKVLV
jgi:homoserine O-acetyltransferase